MRAKPLIAVVLLSAVMAAAGATLTPLVLHVEKQKSEPIYCDANMVADPSSPCWVLPFSTCQPLTAEKG